MPGIMSARVPRSSVRILLLSVFAMVSLTSAGRPAWAAGKEKDKDAREATDDSAAAQARLHYQKAASLYELGRYQEAIPEYEAAFQLKNDPAFLYNLAQCHRLAGNLEQALHFYRRYLVKDPKETKPALRADAESRITQLEKTIAQKNAIKTTPPNEQTSPGGTEPPPPGATTTTTPPVPPVPVPPAGTDTTAAPPPPPLPAPPVLTTTPPASPEVDPRARRYQRAGAIGAGVGGAMIVVGLIFGTRAAGAGNEVMNAARDGLAFDPEVEKRGKRFQALELGFVLTGAVIGGVGTWAFFHGRTLQREVGVTPMASSSGAGGMLRVTF
jgi:hypothetical protein